MKGISMPIETIVIVAITVLVLTVVAVFFVGGAGQQVGKLGDQQAFGEGCIRLPQSPYFCKPEEVSNVQIPGYSGGNLFKACNALGYTTEEDCARACRCPV